MTPPLQARDKVPGSAPPAQDRVPGSADRHQSDLGTAGLEADFFLGEKGQQPFPPPAQDKVPGSAPLAPG